MEPSSTETTHYTYITPLHRCSNTCCIKHCNDWQVETIETEQKGGVSHSLIWQSTSSRTLWTASDLIIRTIPTLAHICLYVPRDVPVWICSYHSDKAAYSCPSDCGPLDFVEACCHKSSAAPSRNTGSVSCVWGVQMREGERAADWVMVPLTVEQKLRFNLSCRSGSAAHVTVCRCLRPKRRFICYFPLEKWRGLAPK